MADRDQPQPGFSGNEFGKSIFPAFSVNVPMPSRKGALFQMSGGTLNVQALAVGDRARATVNNAAAALEAQGRDDVLVKLTAVLNDLEAHGAALPDKPTADALVERIATEAANKTPDKLALKSFLSILADEVKSVSGIATTVTALAGAIGALFG